MFLMKDSIINNSIENLYLIGNGFDIHHKIKCRYSDFQEWLYENNPVISVPLKWDELNN